MSTTADLKVCGYCSSCGGGGGGDKRVLSGVDSGKKNTTSLSNPTVCAKQQQKIKIKTTQTATRATQQQPVP